MFCRRKITLHGEDQCTSDLLIPREALAEGDLAEKIITRAQARAEVLIDQARHLSQTLRENACREFWDRATEQLNHWDRERQLMVTQVEQVATRLTNKVLVKLTGEIPDEQRIAIMLRQLLETTCPSPQVTLRCHSRFRAAISQWLGEERSSHWILQSDDLLDEEALILETDEGDLRIDWSSATQALLLSEY